ncbi:MAG: DUF2017 family protein [Actinomycetota bacterium]
MKDDFPIARTKNGKFKINLHDDHREVLQELIEQFRETLTSAASAKSAASATGVDHEASLRRLFPTAYHNDAKADAEYQRLMRDELFASRLASAEVASTVIASKNEISAEEMDAFTRSVNSLRLVLGTTLDIAESDYGAGAKEARERHQADDTGETEIQRELYEYLGWLLEWCVMAQSESN